METGTPLYLRPGSTSVLQGLGLSARPSGGTGALSLCLQTTPSPKPGCRSCLPQADSSLWELATTPAAPLPSSYSWAVSPFGGRIRVEMIRS